MERETDFSEWTKKEIESYLDRMGEDRDDCDTLQALVQRGRQCEIHSGVAATKNVDTEQNGEEEEEDPLDAFMKDIDETLARQGPGEVKSKGELMIEEDPGIDYLNLAVDKRQSLSSNEEKQATHGIPKDAYNTLCKSLQNTDHVKESYQPFKKNFVGQIPPVMDDFNCIFGNDSKLLSAIHRAGFFKPTQIQSKAIPEISMGKDCLGIAETGSGKTLAFVLPMIPHIAAQQRPSLGEGPIAVILAPTRELAEQIHSETRKFGTKTHRFKSCAAFGGLDKYHQIKELKAGVDIVVATPGRLLDLVKSKACRLKQATYLVIDEVDRMLDLGFEPQVQAIVSQIRPDRQVVMFSATMPKKVQSLANAILKNHVTLNIKSKEKLKIRQSVHVINNIEEKKAWLLKRVEDFVDQGNVIIFCNQKDRVEEIQLLLTTRISRLGMLHGDMDQGTRMKQISQFKSGAIHVLVATDIAARGLDIDTLQVVINFDMHKELNQYIHRVGRVGRGENKDGEAYSLLLPNEHRQAVYVVKYLEDSGAQVPEYVSNLVQRHSKKRAANVWTSSKHKGSQDGKEEPKALSGFVRAPSNHTSVSDIKYDGKIQASIVPPSKEKKIIAPEKKSRWDT